MSIWYGEPLYPLEGKCSIYDNSDAVVDAIKLNQPSAIQLLDQENKLLLAQLEHYRQEVRELKTPTIAVSARKGRDKPRGKPRKSLPAGQVLPADGVCIQVP